MSSNLTDIDSLLAEVDETHTTKHFDLDEILAEDDTHDASPSPSGSEKPSPGPEKPSSDSEKPSLSPSGPEKHQTGEVHASAGSTPSRTPSASPGLKPKQPPHPDVQAQQSNSTSAHLTNERRSSPATPTNVGDDGTHDSTPSISRESSVVSEVSAGDRMKGFFHFQFGDADKRETELKTVLHNHWLLFADHVSAVIHSVKHAAPEACSDELRADISALEGHLAETLSDLGIERMKADGQHFDAHQHRLGESANDEFGPTNAIVRTLHPGYVYTGKSGPESVVRPAVVCVNKPDQSTLESSLHTYAPPAALDSDTPSVISGFARRLSKAASKIPRPQSDSDMNSPSDGQKPLQKKLASFSSALKPSADSKIHFPSLPVLHTPLLTRKNSTTQPPGAVTATASPATASVQQQQQHHQAPPQPASQAPAELPHQAPDFHEYIENLQKVVHEVLLLPVQDPELPSPITDAQTTVAVRTSLSTALMTIVSLGFKPKPLLGFGLKTIHLWNLFEAVLRKASVTSLTSLALARAVQAVLEHRMLLDPDARTRALVCQCLNQQILHNCFEALSNDTATLHKFYDERIVTMMPSLLKAMAEAVKPLSERSFHLGLDLGPNERMALDKLKEQLKSEGHLAHT